jgi:hypothetical protein
MRAAQQALQLKFLISSVSVTALELNCVNR